MTVDGPKDWRPVPDPTQLTNELVEKANAALKAVIEARLAAIDAQIALLQADIRSRPAEIEHSITHLERLHDQKFATVAEQFSSVQKQFNERDERSRDAKIASDTAVSAALQAQKEAAGESAKSFALSIDKSERATLEQITQQRSQIQSSTTNLDGKIDDLKERVTRIEGAAVGIVSAKTEQVTTHTAISQNVGILVAIAAVVLTALIFLADKVIR